MKLPHRRQFLRLAAGAAALPAVSRIVRAQAYPVRPVRIIVPFPAGIGIDAIAHIVGGRLAEIWGAQVVIENRTGVGGNIGSEAVAKSNPDGYTILCNGPAIGLNRFLFNHLAYDPIDDFAPISLLCTFCNIMIVPISLPVRSVTDFITFARENAGKVTFVAPGVGTTNHLSGELFKRMTRIEMTAVPYRDASFFNDLFARRVDLIFGAPPSLEHHKAGRLRQRCRAMEIWL